jgi:hypothetical protein
MSTALASARRRRAGPEAVAPAPGVRQTTPQPSFPGSQQQQQQQQQQSQNMGPGLTLPQVIALVDKRLITLETFMQTQQTNVSTPDSESENQLNTIINEYNMRFDMLAEELISLKDTIMKLQTYTMEVNKTLMEDRIRILSDEPTPLEKALSAIERN